MLHVIVIGEWPTSHSWRWWTLHHHQSFWTALSVPAERSCWAAAVTAYVHILSIIISVYIPYY